MCRSCAPRIRSAARLRSSKKHDKGGEGTRVCARRTLDVLDPYENVQHQQTILLVSFPPV
jgi:hypothetical protein